MQAGGVLHRAVASVGAKRTVVKLGRPRGVDEGVVVEVPRLAAALLPDQQPRVPLPDFPDLLPHQSESLVPGNLLPLAGYALLVESPKGGLHPVGVVDGLNLAHALGAEGTAVAGVH